MAIANNKLENNNKKELSIQISLNGLSFCVLNKQSNTINTISFLKRVSTSKKETPFKILDLLIQEFDSEEQLNQPFTSVQVVHDNELSTIVPKELFDEAHLADYLKFNSKILKSDFIAFDDIKVNNSANVYVPYVNINNFIYDKFGSFSYKHVSTILLEKILEAEQYAHNSKMYIHVEQSHFNVIVVSKGKLILYNTFEYNSKEDFIYYVLFSLEQLELSPETIDIILLGNISMNDPIYDMIYKYVRHVSFGTRFDDYKFTTPVEANHSNFPIIHSF